LSASLRKIKKLKKVTALLLLPMLIFLFLANKQFAVGNIALVDDAIVIRQYKDIVHLTLA